MGVERKGRKTTKKTAWKKEPAGKKGEVGKVQTANGGMKAYEERMDDATGKENQEQRRWLKNRDKDKTRRMEDRKSMVPKSPVRNQKRALNSFDPDERRWHSARKETERGESDDTITAHPHPPIFLI